MSPSTDSHSEGQELLSYPLQTNVPCETSQRFACFLATGTLVERFPFHKLLGRLAMRHGHSLITTFLLVIYHTGPFIPLFYLFIYASGGIVFFTFATVAQRLFIEYVHI